jgi:hypothetical protein
VTKVEAATVNPFGTPSDERALHAPNCLVRLPTDPPSLYFMALETKGRAWKPATAPKTPRGGFPFERPAKFDATKPLRILTLNEAGLSQTSSECLH